MQHLVAEVFFLPTDDGGRKSAVFSGYRGQFYYREDCDVEWTFPDDDVVEPGRACRALLRFYRPEAHLAHMSVGMPFLIREGAKTVGYGTIKQLITTSAPSEPRT